MNILFFVDLHEDDEAIEVLRNKSAGADVLVCSGDVSIMENNLTGVLEKLNSFKKPIFMIHGNHEDHNRMRRLCDDYEHITFLHKAVHHMDNVAFVGYGGDGFSTTDKEFEHVADHFFKKEVEGKDRIIFFTHGPPHGTEIDKINMDHRGNKSYRKFIDDVKPHVVSAGHLHENAGKHHQIGRTVFINPGKKGVLVEI